MLAVPRTEPSEAPTRTTAKVWPVIGTGVKPRWIEICAHSATSAGAATDEKRVREEAWTRMNASDGGWRLGFPWPSDLVPEGEVTRWRNGLATGSAGGTSGGSLGEGRRYPLSAATCNHPHRQRVLGARAVMKDIIEILERWTNEGRAVALGSVVERIGSAPRDPGATLAVSTTGEVVGGVTGGCVEPGVIHEANEVLAGARRAASAATGSPATTASTSGSPCGGTIAVAVYALDASLVPPSRRRSGQIGRWR